MTPEQKHRAAELLSAWRATAYALHADRMADLLQELVDAPEPEPVARVTGYYAGYLSIATVDGRVLPAGTALYLAPPAPSVPDGWKLVPVEPTPEPFGYFKAEPFGWTDCAETDDGAIALFDAPPAPTPAEAPADVARDAERLDWLLRNLPGDALRYCVGVLSDTSDGKEFREAIDAAIERQGDES